MTELSESRLSLSTSREGRAKLRREFQNSQTLTERTRALTAISTGATLYLLFLFLDQAWYPSEIQVLMTIRLVAVSCMLISLVLVARARSYWAQVVPSALVWIVGAGGIGLMCHATEGFGSPYWAGLPLCGIAATIFTWPPRVAGISFVLGLLPYYAPLLMPSHGVDWQDLSISSSFIFATFLFALLGIQIQQRLAMRAFLSHRQLERSHAQLARLDRSKNQMFQNVSHELRTPLTLMLSPLDRMVREGRSQAVLERREVTSLHRNGLRLLKQIDDLLELARLDGDRRPADRKATDLVKLISQLVADSTDAAKSRAIELSADLPSEEVLYAVDPDHVERIVLNLISNALKYTGAQGRVEVACRVDQEGVLISVTDNGEGIRSADARRIFGRFERAVPQRSTAPNGAGIGLALVHETVELIGGTVTLESELGRGSRFLVNLPPCFLLDPETETESSCNQQAPLSLSRQAQRTALLGQTDLGRITSGSRGPRVLIAEDDPELRLRLVELLTDQCRLIAVGNGQAAYSEAIAWRPHLVISDVTMPSMGGIELCSQLRKHLEFSGTAVILLTARTSVEERIAGRKVGADAYLTKPFDPAELQAAVMGLLRARSHVIGTYLVRGPLGRGGQSKVLLAEHLETGDLVALKLIASRKIASTGHRRRQLQRELEALMRLEHRNIVRIIDRHEQQGDFFLAMEYLRGLTVSQLLNQKSRFQYSTIAEIGLGLCLAVQAAHDSGLVHRDIKCSNVMLVDQGESTTDQVRLIDFGNVSFQEESTSAHFGTLPYLAPELVFQSRAATKKTDQYALGVTIFKMCTGTLPHPCADLESLRRSLRRLSIPRVSQYREDCPAELDEVVLKAMAADPVARWPDVSAMADRLRPLCSAENETQLIAPHKRNPLAPTESLRASGTTSPSQ